MRETIGGVTGWIDEGFAFATGGAPSACRKSRTAREPDAAVADPDREAISGALDRLSTAWAARDPDRVAAFALDDV